MLNLTQNDYEIQILVERNTIKYLIFILEYISLILYFQIIIEMFEINLGIS